MFLKAKGIIRYIKDRELIFFNVLKIDYLASML